MALKASLAPCQEIHNHAELIAAATNPDREIAPVTQRLVGFPKASASITTTPTMQTINSGRISQRLTSGIVYCRAKKFITKFQTV